MDLKPSMPENLRSGRKRKKGKGAQSAHRSHVRQLLRKLWSTGMNPMMMAEAERKKLKQHLKYDTRVLTQVQILPGLVLPSAPAPAEQHVIKQLSPAVVEPPFVEPPFVEPPFMERPFVERPFVEQPFVERPFVEPPFVQPPAVEPPTVEPPVVQPPVVQPPVVQPPVVQLPEEQQSHYRSLTQGTESHPAVLQLPAVLADAGIGEEFMELDSSNAAKFVTQHSDILLAGTPTQWHQITVKTPVLESKRKFVILAINKRISPLKLTPYFFRMENNRITFFVNLCGLALKTLCRRDLKVPYISDKFVEIEMTIRLFSKNFNLSEALEEVVSRRLDSQKKFLDLSCINSIPEVREMLFDPTDNWHILHQLLKIAELVAPSVVTLGLASNGIRTPTGLWGFLLHCKWKSLRTLDLSDNEIQNTGPISLARNLQISEVYLDHNPICRMHNRGPYISAIKATFPDLAKLDGTYLHTTPRLPYWKPNFIVDDTSDSAELADQFIEHFFTLYDNGDRMKLRGLYHENAYFSLSCLCLDAQLTTPNARLTAYTVENRNLLRCSDMKKARAALTQGSEKILERLTNLPDTQHDPYTFAVDLTVHTLKLTVLTVTGVFRDITKEKSSPRHFSRTFVLTGRENGEYQITNDILYISNATTREAEEAFKFVKPPRIMKRNRPMPNLSEREKESMTRLVQHLTSMSAPWSRKCLEDSDWDLREALEIFEELHETNKIPELAFLNSK